MAVGVIRDNQRSRLGLLWWQLASELYRLFLFLGLLHTTVLTVLYNMPALNVRQDLVIFIAGVAVIAPFILSLLISFLPDWYQSTKIDYDKYGISYYLLFISLPLMELGLVSYDMVFISGGLLLVFSWLTSINIILSSYKWSVRVSFNLASKYGFVMKFLLMLIPVNIMLLFSAYELSFITNLISMVTVLILSVTAFILFHGRQISHKAVACES